MHFLEGYGVVPAMLPISMMEALQVNTVVEKWCQQLE